MPAGRDGLSRCQQQRPVRPTETSLVSDTNAPVIIPEHHTEELHVRQIAPGRLDRDSAALGIVYGECESGPEATGFTWQLSDHDRRFRRHHDSYYVQLSPTAPQGCRFLSFHADQTPAYTISLSALRR